MRASEESSEAPLILTLAIDGASFARFDALRGQHFPPDRNLIPAHLTLFHALPGRELPRVVADLEAACRARQAFELEPVGFRSLGRGVAAAFRSPQLVGLRQELSREWRDWLSPQDSAPLAPHVTVQNKVRPETARALLAALQAGPPPAPVRAEGLLLWRYLGGPWESIRRFRFGG